MRCRKYKWEIYGNEIIDLYNSGLSVREIIPVMQQKYNITFPSGTLTNYVGKNGKLRSQCDAAKLAISKATRICEICQNKFSPTNWNCRWCDECTGQNKFRRRIRSHGLPAVVIEKQFELQNKKCAICGKEVEDLLNTKNKKKLFVDHDHETMQFRGLLCVRCNSGMSFVDNNKWLQNALKYKENAENCVEKIYTNTPRVRKYVRNKPKLIVTYDVVQ